MGHYRIRKDRNTGEWLVQFKDNPPVPHHSFRDAVKSVHWLLHLTHIHHVTKRGKGHE